MSHLAKRVLLTYLATLVLTCAAMALTGCASSAKKKAAQQAAEAEKHQHYESSAVALMSGDAKAIQLETTRITDLLKETPPNPPLIKAHVQAISDAAGRIADNTGALDKQAAQERTDYAAMKKRAESCESDQDKPLLSLTTAGIVTGGAIIVGGMVAAILAKSITGIPWLSGVGDLSMVGWVLGGLSLGLRLFIEAIGPYRWLIGVVAAGSISVSIVLVVWRGWKRGSLDNAMTKIGDAVKETDAEHPAVPIAQSVADKAGDSAAQLAGLPSTPTPT